MMDSNNTIVNIKHLECIYLDDPVLICEDILLEKGNLYFMVGKSGMGKSTFLEAVGLMTNTIGAYSEVAFTGYDGNLKDIWSDEKVAISNFRKKNFSFIFQSTNLMENFTAGENMCFGKMISGSNFEEAKSSVLELMAKMDLDKSLFDREINKLSGGQRQRLAFIRAITADFEMMFCDEPTGNLDPLVANKLMTFLKESIKALGKTVIIVSHDIDLAMSYADQILILEPKRSPYIHGKLSPTSTITKNENQWYSSTNKKIENVRKFIVETMSGNSI